MVRTTMGDRLGEDVKEYEQFSVRLEFYPPDDGMDYTVEDLDLQSSRDTWDVPQFTKLFVNTAKVSSKVKEVIRKLQKFLAKNGRGSLDARSYIPFHPSRVGKLPRNFESLIGTNGLFLEYTGYRRHVLRSPWEETREDHNEAELTIKICVGDIEEILEGEGEESEGEDEDETMDDEGMGEGSESDSDEEMGAEQLPKNQAISL